MGPCLRPAGSEGAHALSPLSPPLSLSAACPHAITSQAVLRAPGTEWTQLFPAHGAHSPGCHLPGLPTPFNPGPQGSAGRGGAWAPWAPGAPRPGWVAWSPGPGPPSCVHVLRPPRPPSSSARFRLGTHLSTPSGLAGGSGPRGASVYTGRQRGQRREATDTRHRPHTRTGLSAAHPSFVAAAGIQDGGPQSGTPLPSALCRPGLRCCRLRCVLPRSGFPARQSPAACLEVPCNISPFFL